MLAGIQRKLIRSKPDLESQAKRRKAVGLIYGRDDLPPLGTLSVLGLQHAVESANKIALPVAVLLSLGASQQPMQTMITVTLIATGVCSILVSSRQRLLGFGHLVPSAVISSLWRPL